VNQPIHFSKLPLDGSLLLASPSLQDGVFDDSVIIVHTHREKGSEGLILNRPTGQTVGDFMCSNHFEALKDLPLYYGGPVAEDQLSFASFRWEVDGRMVCKPSISMEDAMETMHKSGSLLRAYLGSSLWSKGQLQDELDNYVWFVAPASSRVLNLPQDETLWKNTMQALSPFHHIISLTPENPFLN